MDKTILVMFPLHAGEKLLDFLDRDPSVAGSFPVKSAFWVYRPESGHWRLYLASSVVDDLGPLVSYGHVQNALNRMKEAEGEQGSDSPYNELTLSDISVVGLNHKLVREIRRIVGKGATNTRIRAGFVDDISLEEGYVYCVD